MVAPRAAGGPITGRGDFRYTSYFKQVQAQLQDAQERAAERTGEWAAEMARLTAPYASGDLHDSIDYEVRRTASNFAIVVFAGEEYALWVELGTSKMEAQPFLRPVLDRIGPVYQAFLVEEVRKVAA
jgi:HK97 gp10 family phage protein